MGHTRPTMCSVTTCPHRIETAHGYVCTATGAVLGVVILTEPFGANKNAAAHDYDEPVAAADAPPDDAPPSQQQQPKGIAADTESAFSEILRQLFHADALDRDLHIEAYSRELTRLRRTYATLTLHRVPFVLAVMYMLKEGDMRVRGREVMRQDAALAALLPNMLHIEARGFRRHDVTAGEKAIRAFLNSAELTDELCVRPHANLMRELRRQHQAAAVGIKRFKLSPRAASMSVVS